MDRYLLFGVAVTLFNLVAASVGVAVRPWKGSKAGATADDAPAVQNERPPVIHIELPNLLIADVRLENNDLCVGWDDVYPDGSRQHRCGAYNMIYPDGVLISATLFDLMQAAEEHQGICLN